MRQNVDAEGTLRCLRALSFPSALSEEIAHGAGERPGAPGSTPPPIGTRGLVPPPAGAPPAAGARAGAGATALAK